MKRFLALALVVSLAPIAGLAPAKADIAYEVVDLTEIWSTTHPLADSVERWESVGLNDAGDVAGTASTIDGGSFAFVWNEESGFRDLSGVGFSTVSCAMNHAGQVAVQNMSDFEDISDPEIVRAYRWDPAGDLIPIIDNSGLFSDTAFFSPRGINDLGEMVGAVYGEPTCGFFWDGDEVTALYGPDGLDEFYTEVSGVNNHGLLVGLTLSGDGHVSPYTWTRDDAGVWIVEELSSPSSDAIALHVNDSGMIAGTCAATETTWTNPVLCRWTDGQFMEIGALGNGARPGFIDESGMIGGSTNDAVSLQTHAFLWTEEDGLQDVNDIVTLDSGWFLHNARDVDSTGVLLVEAMGHTPGVVYRELLLRPVPEPGLFVCVATIVFVYLLTPKRLRTVVQADGRARRVSLVCSCWDQCVRRCIVKRVPAIAVFVVLSTALVFGRNVKAEVAYDVVDLTEIWSTTHPAADSVGIWESVGLNDAGDVAGTAWTLDGGRFAFVWNEESGFRDLSGVGFSTAAYAINQVGQVAVQNVNESGDISDQEVVRVYRWEPTGDMVPIIPDNSDFGADWTSACPFEINDLGQVVGIVIGEPTCGFFWDGDEMVPLYGPNGPEEYYTQVSGINNHGLLVGLTMSGDGHVSPCTWTRDDAGVWIVEELSSPSLDAIALHVNDSGVITGTCAAIETVATNPVLCRWADGEFLEIGALGNEATPYFIDESGMIGGATRDAVSLQTHAFLWTEEDGLQDLNDIVTMDPGWFLYRTRDADGSGTLLVEASGPVPHTGHRGLLLRPVPEPDLLINIATFALVLLAIRPWRKQ